MRRSGRLAVLVAVRFLVGAAILLGPVVDADAQWVRQRQSDTMAEDDGMLAVGAIDEDHAIIFGIQSSGMGSSSPYMFRTSNGGGSWTPGPVGDPSTPFGLEIWSDFEFAGGTGYGLKFTPFGGVKVAKSTDGGGEWADQNIGGLSSDGLTALYARDGEHVWGVGGAIVARTSNGLAWSTATVPNAPSDLSLSGVHFVDADNGWVVGGAYEEVTETDPNTGQEVVVDKRILPQGTIAATTDGGATWTTLRSGDQAVYGSVAFTTPTRGVLVGWDNAGPFVLATSDGGATWDTANLPAGPEGKDYYFFSKVRCPDPLHCWVVGGAGSEEGGFMNRPVFLFSSNGGLSWQLQAPDQGAGLVIDVDFLDAHRGWACGNFGQIWYFDDGAAVNPDVGPGADAGPTGDGAGPATGPWGEVFGTFVDGRVPAVGSSGGGGGGTPGPTDAGPTGAHDGSITLTDLASSGGGGGTAAGGDDCGGGGGCSASAGAGVSFPSVFVLLALALGFALRRRVRRIPSGAGLVPLLTVALAAALTAGGCDGGGGGDCAPGGSDAAVAGYDATAPTDLAIPEPPKPEDGPFCVNRIDAPAPVVTGNEPGATTRTADGDPRLVVARAAAEGGSDLWLYEPVGDVWTQLTFFRDPAVDVWDPAWSPDRQQVVFVSNFGAERSPLESNLFVVLLDGTGCRQVTPVVQAGHLATEGASTGTVQGIVREPIGSAGIVSPVDGATVHASTTVNSRMTDANGGFSLEVPAGPGTLVIRRINDDGIDEATIDYTVDAGQTKDLGQILTDGVGTTVRLRAPTWQPDGTAILFRADTTLHMASGDRQRSAIEAIGVGGDGYDVLSTVTDAPLGTPVFDPHEAELVLGTEDGLAFAPADDPETPRLPVPLDTWERSARPAFSAHRFLAAVVPAESAREVMVVGADAQGQLETHVLTDFADSSLAWDGVDWAPNGQQLALVRDEGAGADLWILDALSRETRRITDDGSVRGVAWFGR